MTSEEIKDRKREPSTLTEEWIREIAYQLAVMNEREVNRFTVYDKFEQLINKELNK